VRDRPAELKRGLRLEYFTVAWNIAEAVVGMFFGLLAGSVALVGFALDSVVESSSGGVLIWRLRAEQAGQQSAEVLERKAVRGVAIAFAVLAAYVGLRSVLALVTRSHPDESIPGIVLACVSLVVMPILASRKRVVAGTLDSRSLQADSKQTILCTYLSAVLLAGLSANAWLGWWWADPAAGIAISVFAAREAIELWRTKDFCCI
jgi:divalent metal cation (Fe/Co/Zn/Cd) transporter